MGIVGLVIQQHDGTILFQNVREYLTPDKAQQIAKSFRRQIVNYDESKTISTNHLSGSIVVLNMYRVYYMVLNEVFILAISQANDNPYEGSNYLARSKRVLQSISKDITVAQISKKYTEIYFALERVLFGEDGVEVLHQRLNEMQPHIIPGSQVSSSIGENIKSNLPGMSSGVQVIPTPINISGKLIDLGSGSVETSIVNSIQTPTNSNYEQLTSSQSYVGINKLENVPIPSKIFTLEASLPKTDKHIYDPPQTVKWGTTNVAPQSSNTSTRVTNRIMFTLRHPNAGNRDRENSGSPPNFSSSPENSLPTSPDQVKDITGTLEMNDKISKDHINVHSKDNDNEAQQSTNEIPKRKFSLSMGTFKNSNNSSDTTPIVPDIRNSKDGNIDSPVIKPISDPVPVPSPTQSTKTKINFLQF